MFRELAWPIALAAIALWNLATWATYRVDKARARAGRAARRMPERVLLGMAAAGGSLGALVAVYLHRHRHKAQKRSFVLRLWAIVLGHVGLAVLIAYARWSMASEP